MAEMRILSPTAILGYGFPGESLARGLAAGPDVIGVDAGSIDPGPSYLGSGKPLVGREAVKRDLAALIDGGRRLGIPVIVGTAGGSGAQPHVDRCLSIVEEIACERGAALRVAVIYTDVTAGQVEAGLAAGRIRPLSFAPPLTVEAIRRSAHIVAQVGVEPIVAALAEPVDVVLVGRCYDPAPFAAPALARGFNPGPALHLGKILECGAIAATPGSGRDCVLGVLREDSFVLESLNAERRFTVESVAAHTLYEKPHPFLLHGPGGHLDLSDAEYRQLTDSSVEVTGSRFVPAERHEVKLEGAARVGFRTVCICGIRDAVLLGQLDSFLDAVRDAVAGDFEGQDYRLGFRVYGRDGVMGPREPEPHVTGHEVGVVIDVVAPIQDAADAVCAAARSTALHHGYPGRIATAGNLAFPFSPSDISAGPVFEFSVHHLMEIDDPTLAFPVVRLTVGEGA